MPRANGITIKSARELDYMREAGRVASLTKEVLKDAIRPGVTSRELDAIAEREIRSLGAIPSFKGLYGFPATICSSFNEEIVHGIPSRRRLEEGDIISIDLGAVVNGFHSDTAFTVGVGRIDEDSQQLIDATEESLRLAVEQTKAGNRVGDIGAAVQTYAEARGYGVVRQYVGHGIGRALHEDPSVPNYGTPGRGAQIRVGMTVAIEPMLNLGTWDTRVLDDGWTVVTADGSRSAHFEDTVAVTENGPEVLTA
ncbi:MAG: type I methionyl aminopeptidase [Chloroflexi bacterium]|nr:type I methionyl aminopeptidase [Chloroflexota bacterium]